MQFNVCYEGFGVKSRRILYSVTGRGPSKLSNVVYTCKTLCK